MALKICTNCGYEGTAIRRPDEHTSDDDPLAVKVLDKLFFAVTMVPLKFGWIVRLAKRGGAKSCPNCGLPLMVKLSSDAGWLAKRKQEVKHGLVRFDEKKETVVFGKEIILPGDEEGDVVPQAPRPEKLPSLHEMLDETPLPMAVPEAVEPEPAPQKPVKKHDPEAW